MDTMTVMEPPTQEWLEQAFSRLQLTAGAEAKEDSGHSRSAGKHAFSKACVEFKLSIQRLEREEEAIHVLSATSPATASPAGSGGLATVKHTSYDNSPSAIHNDKAGKHRSEPLELSRGDSKISYVQGLLYFIDGGSDRGGLVESTSTSLPSMDHDQPLILQPSGRRISPSRTYRSHWDAEILKNRLRTISEQRIQVMESLFKKMAPLYTMQSLDTRVHNILSIYPRSIGSLDLIDFIAGKAMASSASQESSHDRPEATG